MKITEEMVDYVSALSRLRLPEEEKVKVAAELEQIIGYMDVLNTLDTSGVEPMSHVFPVKNVLRPDVVEPSADRAELLVNCTSLGMAGTGGQFEDLSFLKELPPAAAVCDLIYHPAETELLCRAREAGHPALNGLGMLIYQAVYALEHFADVALDAGAMRALVEQALKEL